MAHCSLINLFAPTIVTKDLSRILAGACKGNLSAFVAQAAGFEIRALIRAVERNGQKIEVPSDSIVSN